MTICGLVTLLPLLAAVWLLGHGEMLSGTQIALGLGFAALVSILGCLVVSRTFTEISRLAARARAILGEAGGQRARLDPAPVPALGRVAELSSLGHALEEMTERLQASTTRFGDVLGKLDALTEIVNREGRPSPPEDLDGVLDNTMRTVHATIGSIMLPVGDRRTLRIAAARGLPADVVVRTEVPVGDGIAGTVFASGEAVFVDDIATDPRFEKENDPKYQSGSFICLPIRAAGQVIGVLNLSRKDSGNGLRPGAFSPSDFQFLNTLMTYIGYRVQNAELKSQTTRSTIALEQTLDDLKNVQAQLVRGETLRAIGQLASGMAHHLNNLFMVISGRTQLLTAKLADPDLLRHLGLIEQSVRDAAEVTRRVQRFSRVEPVAEPVRVDLDALIAEVVELTRPRWHDEAQVRGITIEVKVQCGMMDTVAGEPSALREVIMNLLLNAMDALPSGGTVTIRTWQTASSVHCSVSDTGVGMSEEVRRRALEPFFTTKGPRSTGLGLSVNYGIVKRHGGELTVDSALGKGSTVTFLLPTGGRVAHHASTSDPEPTPLRLLLIDDEAHVRDTIGELLVLDGHTVISAESGEEGLDILERGVEIDAVLTDLGMPRMRGWRVAEVVKHRWPELPVGLLTGWLEAAAASEQVSQVDFVLFKPIEVSELRRRLARIQPRR